MARLTSAAVPCAVTFCVCLAQRDGVKCSVHAQQNALYRPLELDAGDDVTAQAVIGDCDDCDGTGICDLCAGAGEHRCDDSRCRDSHRCGACYGGDGKCRYCKGSGWANATVRPGMRKITKRDAAYLRFAFDAGLSPLPALFACPWDRA